MAPLTATLVGPRGTFQITYNPEKPMALDMLWDGVDVTCAVFIGEDQPNKGHVVCGIAATGEGYWFELHLKRPLRLDLFVYGPIPVAHAEEISN